MSDREFSSNDDLSLPKATVQKIITEILPPSSGQTFSKDARDLLMECCVEFITLISSEANDISEKEAKKTIACEHVEKALRDLGFGDYIPDVLAVAMEHREALKTREKKGEQDGAERPVRGRTVAATARAISFCDCEVSRRSGIVVFSSCGGGYFILWLLSLAPIPDLLAVFANSPLRYILDTLQQRWSISGSYNKCVCGVLWSYRSFGIWQVYVITISYYYKL